MIFLLHIALSVSSPALNPVLFKSRWQASFHLVFGRPLFLFPGISALNTFLSMCLPSVIGGEHSTWTQVKSGVPQGTVLGPLLFLTNINDLTNNIHSSIRLFADDCVLYREIKNEIDSQELQKDFNSLKRNGSMTGRWISILKMFCNETNTR